LNHRIDYEKVSGSGCVHNRWAVVAHPRRGGHDPPIQVTFKTVCDWIRHELEEELRQQWKIKANGVGVPHHK